MKRMLLPLLLMLCAPLPELRSGEPVHEAERLQLAARIQETAASTRTLQCRFTQVRTMSVLTDEFRSEGRLYYVRPQRLRWQYTSPYQYDFLMNGNEVTLRSEQSRQTIDAAENKMFRQVCAVIAGGIDGSLLQDSRSYRIGWVRSEGAVEATLQPLNKPFKDLFRAIVIRLETATWSVTDIIMEETGGDSTHITFTDSKINEPIDEQIFQIQ